MQLIEAPDLTPALFRSVFIGGGISKCPDWQSPVISDIGKSPKSRELTVYNPRRAYFPMHDQKQGRIQIVWEYDRLEIADIAAFWFCKETMNPIVIWELSAALRREQIIIIGVHPEYERAFDIEIQTELRRPHLRKYCSPIVHDLKSFAREIIEQL